MATESYMVPNGDVIRPPIYKTAIHCAAVMKLRAVTDLHTFLGFVLQKSAVWVQDANIPRGEAASACIRGVIKVATAPLSGVGKDLPVAWSYAHECAHILFKHYKPNKISFGKPAAAEEYTANLFAFSYLVTMGSVDLMEIYRYTSTANQHGRGPIFLWNWDELQQELLAIMKLWEPPIPAKP